VVAATVTELTYEGGRVVRETATTGATVITRAFTVDEAGAIVRMTITGDPVALHNGTYLVTWNGHGDALALERLDPGTGTLTVANRFSYSTWGTPTLTLHNGYGDLGFRYRYVGQWGVASDGYAGADLLAMRARHYSPELGRFLQPDPARAEDNPYAYAGNNPTSCVDPSGTFGWGTGRMFWTYFPALRELLWGIRVDSTENFVWFTMVVRLERRWANFLWFGAWTGDDQVLITGRGFIHDQKQRFTRIRCGDVYRIHARVLTSWPPVVPWDFTSKEGRPC
jgi:RHS repeat-associated protein